METQLDWEKAEKRLWAKVEKYQGTNWTPGVGSWENWWKVLKFAERFEAGERTQALYSDIMEFQ